MNVELTVNRVQHMVYLHVGLHVTYLLHVGLRILILHLATTISY